jgi:hypothetical protein
MSAATPGTFVVLLDGSDGAKCPVRPAHQHFGAASEV